MKKVFASVLAIGMILSMTGCAKGGKYSKTSKKLIKAAESTMDAEEGSKKVRKAFQKDTVKPTDEMFNDGFYCTYSGDETEDFTMDDCMDEGDAKNLTVICKSEDKSCVYSYIVELQDKDIAEDVYDNLLENLSSNFPSEKEMKKKSKEANFEYALNDESETEYAFIMVNEDNGQAVSYYLNIDGSVITFVACACYTDADLYEEYYDFTKEAGLADFEEMLEDA